MFPIFCGIVSKVRTDPYCSRPLLLYVAPRSHKRLTLTPHSPPQNAPVFPSRGKVLRVVPDSAGECYRAVAVAAALFLRENADREEDSP